MALTTQPVDMQSRDKSTLQEVGGESSASMKLGKRMSDYMKGLVKGRKAY